MTRWKRHLTTQFAVAILFAGLVNAQNRQREPPTGTVQQALVGDTLIDAKVREEFGLLTLTTPGGTCSASMLNDFWAITAAHCVFSPTTGVQFSPTQIRLTANWPGLTKTVQVIRVIPYSNAAPWTPSDIAILQTGRRGFSRPRPIERKLHDQRPMANLTVYAFGRGINRLAFQSGPTAIPSQGDGQYRSARFDIASINPNSNLPPQDFSFASKNGAILAGGDSGGPSFIEEWDNNTSRRKLEWRLIGVHSNCQFTCLPGQLCTAPNPWMWAASVQRCADAAILPVRNQILEAIQDYPPDTDYVGTFPTTPESVLRQKRALYALNIDEPLIAPPDAAIDIQLTFQNCHNLARVGVGCQVTPAHEQWSYDSATRRLLHVASGKCLNISGARHDAGAPIILYPCSNAPNEKWTVISQPGSSIWTVKSDLTSQCLHAIPGSPGGGDRLRMRVATRAKLVQMPCNGSDAQRFANVDADWFRRNGPR